MHFRPLCIRLFYFPKWFFALGALCPIYKTKNQFTSKRTMQFYHNKNMLLIYHVKYCMAVFGIEKICAGKEKIRKVCLIYIWTCLFPRILKIKMNFLTIERTVWVPLLSVIRILRILENTHLHKNNSHIKSEALVFQNGYSWHKVRRRSSIPCREQYNNH